ncbi:MAG: putative C-S lyase [Betaproteobacteria bacterium]|nr:putative C-S lyase [Betaproteobacteria bacterium]
MNFDFDHPIDRRGSDSTKWGKYAGSDRDVIPLWVADMDFAAPPAVLEALHQRVAHGVFGYGAPQPSLTRALQEHLLCEYQWQVEADWLVWLPGLVTGLNVACRAVGGAGDEVLTATPIYPPFLSAPGHAQRRVVGVPLVLGDDGWKWDFAALAAAITPATKLLLLCHPHNPVGRAWRSEELQQIAAFAERHNLTVCSDEIHCGLILDPQLQHQPFAALSKAAARRSITLMAPSKTFNIPGLGCAFAVISDAALRRAFRTAMQGIVPHVNLLGFAATEAALNSASDWHAALLAYLRGNRDCVERQIGQMPGLSMSHVEATYLAWIDARELCQTIRQTRSIRNPQRFFEQAGVGLSDGAAFSPGESRQPSPTSGFVRLNFGCSRTLLKQALERMRNALTK